jgi:hypothetical protein
MDPGEETNINPNGKGKGKTPLSLMKTGDKRGASGSPPDSSYRSGQPPECQYQSTSASSQIQHMESRVSSSSKMSIQILINSDSGPTFGSAQLASSSVSESRTLAPHHAGFDSGVRERERREQAKIEGTILAEDKVWYCSDCLRKNKEKTPLKPPQFNPITEKRCNYRTSHPGGKQDRCKQIFNEDDGDVVQTEKDPPPMWASRHLTRGQHLPWSKDKQGHLLSPWTYAHFRDLPEDQAWPDWYCCKCKKQLNKHLRQVIQVRYCKQPRLPGGFACMHEACKDCSAEPWPLKKVPKWWCCQCKFYVHDLFQEPLDVKYCDRIYKTAVPYTCWHSQCKKYSSTGDEEWINDRFGML